MDMLRLAFLLVVATCAVAGAQENSTPNSDGNLGAPPKVVPNDRGPPSNIEEFYVMQDSTNGRCTIMTTKPTDLGLVVIGTGGHKSRKEALTAMRLVRSCNTD